jgi:hypothetical protein
MEGEMRIVLLLLAASLGTAAPAARPASGSMAGSPSPHGAWNGGGWKRVWRNGPRPGGDHGPGRDRWRGHQGRDEPVFYPYSAGGLDAPVEAVDPHGNGFFAGGGGEVRIEGGRPHYDYDRSYPYEWAPAGGAGRARGGEQARPAQAYCTMENGVRVCRGGW